MNDHLTWYTTVRESSYVERVHTIQTIGNQTNGHHQYNVAMLALVFTNGKPSANLLKACLSHDIHEIVSGDSPSPIKWHGKLREALEELEKEFNDEHGLRFDLTDQEKLVLKWADGIEFAFYCIDQIEMGNRKMIKPLGRSIKGVSSLERIDAAIPFLDFANSHYIYVKDKVYANLTR